MDLIDYTGKLKNHEDYLKMLKKLEKECAYIEMVIINEVLDNELIKNFYNDIILTKKVSKWWGTKTSGKNNLYRIKASKDIFKYLRQYETFCKYY